MQINITVRNQSIIDICPCVVLAEDNQNYVTAVFTFLTDDWDNTEKTAQFQNPKTGEVYESILDSGNACTVRWEALSDSGDMNVAVFGVNGGYRVTTNMGVITVLPTLSGGESDTPPSPDVYQQLLTMLGQKADNITYSDNVLRLLSGSKELARVIIAGGGESVQPDWNQNDSGAADYIKNRPFYDDTNVLLEWDGNTEGLVAAVAVDEVEGFPAGTALAYKVAEYMDPESFIGTTVITSDGVEIKITEGDIWQDNGVYSIGGMIYTTNAQATAHSLNFPDPGTYIFLYDGIYASEIIAGGITKLPDKYLDYDSGELSKIPLIVIITFFQGVSFSETYEVITQALNDDRPVIGIAHYNGYKLALPYWDTTARRVYFYSVNGFMSWKRVYIGISEKGYDNTIYISDIPALTPDGQETNAGCVIVVSSTGSRYQLKKLTAEDVNALGKDNTTEYTPTGDYNPATKKYVDDAVSGASAATPRQQMTAEDTTVTLQPGILYAFPEMATLAVTLAAPTNTDIVNEYMFTFTSGATATTLSLPDSVITDIAVEPNTYYECSIIDNHMVFHEWEVTT